MRTVTGEILLPANAPAATADLVLVEVRDVSLADVPSVVIAQQQLPRVRLQPNGRIPFKVLAPEVEPNRMLSLRVHVSRDGSDGVKVGDLLTVRDYPIPSTGTPMPLEVAVSAV